MSDLLEGQPEYDPVEERLRTIFMIEGTLDLQLRLGTAAIQIVELAEKPEFEEDATWQSRIVLLGQIGVQGINQNSLFAGYGVGLTAYTKFSTGYRYAHVSLFGEGRPNRYILAAPSPGLAISGVNQKTAAIDRRVFDLLTSAEFYRGKAEVGISKSRANEPPLQRIPPWPRDGG